MGLLFDNQVASECEAPSASETLDVLSHTDQASKGTGWMSRHGLAMKDVASCDKPGGAASEL